VQRDVQFSVATPSCIAVPRHHGKDDTKNVADEMRSIDDS
jgi:hypothetical protein